jgi:ribosomal-protein-alanine N-acetyltransferase
MIRPLTQYDAACMANIHRYCFQDAWSVETFSDYFSKPEWKDVFGFAITHGHTNNAHVVGFILGRTLYDNNDILTFAVDPLHQNQGFGHKLLTTYLKAVPHHCMLEVATGNTAAIHLYTSFGFEIITTRREYYKSQDPAMRDAYVMSRKNT